MIVYQFPKLEEETVKERLNRFMVSTQSGKLCHLHDPGRLKELIYPGNKILVREVDGNKRKTSYQVTAAWNGLWVIVDSSIHNDITRKFLPNAKAEVKVGNSRIDFQDGNTFIEVKGCSLVENGVAMFPDAPTERGRRHLEELIKLKEKGYNAKLLVLVMRDDAKCFYPNERTDKKFSEKFFEALHKGVEVEIKTFSLIESQVIYKRNIQICDKIN
ncbi:DNA/RNA nuclease SfsA [Saccharolobus solfataricus]